MGCAASHSGVDTEYPLAGAPPLFLYYWDMRDGESWSGWWITPNTIGDMKFVMHNASQAGLPGQCPKGGWFVGSKTAEMLGGQPGCYVKADGDGWCVTGGTTQKICGVDYSQHIFMPYGTNHGRPAYKAVLRSEAPSSQASVEYGAGAQEVECNLEGEEIPGAYFASGAAIPAANGFYVRDGTYSGAPLFKNGQLWLLRYTIGTTRYWYIADKALLDSDDGDLYRVRCTGALPPQFGWTLAKDGVAPAPTMQPVADQGPSGFFVANAGHPDANGTYARDGSYSSCPLFKQVNGSYWLLRYTLPSGARYWYIAHSAMLDSDDGDLYRARSDSDFPPLDGWSLAKDGVAPAPMLSPLFSQPAAPALAQPVPIAQPVAVINPVPVAQPVAVGQPMAIAQPVAQPVAQPPAAVEEEKGAQFLVQFVSLAHLMKDKVVKGQEPVERLPLPNPEHPAWYAHYQSTGTVLGREMGEWTLTNVRDESDVKRFTDSRDFAREAVRLLNLVDDRLPTV